MGIEGHLCCLTGCGVAVLLGQRQVVFAISALVIECADAHDALVKRGDIARVAAICIRPWLLGRRHQLAVGHYVAVGGGPVGACLDVAYLAEGNVVEVYHVPADMRLQGLFAEQVSTTGHTMFQGQCLDGERAVVIDHLLPGSVDGMEVDFIIEVVAEQLHLQPQHLLQCLWCVDGQTCRASQQSEGAQHAYEPEAMVAVQMADEDGTDFSKPYVRTPELYLRAFATVYQEELPPHLHHLCRGMVAGCGECAAAAQDMYSERFQG